MNKEEARETANEMADSITQSFKELKSSKFGRLKHIGLDSLSVLAGLTVGGACRAANLGPQTTTAVIIGFALPNLVMANTIPRPNRLSSIINYETAKYLISAIVPYADKMYQSF